MSTPLGVVLAAYALAGRAARWLEGVNGRSSAQRILAAFAVADEFGELCEELERGMGRRVDRVAEETVDVILAALTAQAVYGHQPFGMPDLPAATVPYPTVVTDLRAVCLGTACGRVAKAVRGERGQNPRRGRTHTVEDVAGQLAGVVAAAVEVLATLGVDPERTISECIARVNARLDGLGVAR